LPEDMRADKGIAFSQIPTGSNWLRALNLSVTRWDGLRGILTRSSGVKRSDHSLRCW